MSDDDDAVPTPPQGVMSGTSLDWSELAGELVDSVGDLETRVRLLPGWRLRKDGALERDFVLASEDQVVEFFSVAASLAFEGSWTLDLRLQARRARVGLRAPQRARLGQSELLSAARIQSAALRLGGVSGTASDRELGDSSRSH